MTASENSQEQQQLPEKEEFFDAVRRHICQALGFDFVFVDVVREPEIINYISFSAEDEDKEAREFVDTLSDENQQPLTVANTHVAQKVKQTQRPWIGKVYMASGKVPAEIETDLDDDDLDGEISPEKEGYPYSIVPILQTPLGNAGTVRGLIRVLSFDPTREITQQDLATLKLMGEHLSTKMSQFSPAGETQPAEQNRVAFDSEYVLIVHSNRLVRRRYSRILTANYQVMEADNADKALEALQNNRVDLIVLDSEVKGKSGYAFCRVLKESTQYKHVPVILVTSDTNPTARVDGLNVGADDCLSESCFDSELLARVKSSMRHRKTERELAIQLQLLEDYAQRLEQATEHLSQDKQLQLKRNRELELLRWESDILRSQDTLLHRISNTIRQSFNITDNLHKMLEAFSGWFNLDCCFVVLPSDDEPEDSIRSEYYSDEEYSLMQQDVDLRTLDVFKQNFQGEQLLMANDAAHDRRLEPFRKDALPNYHFFSLFFVPITYEQKLLGLLGGYKCESQANWNRDNEAFLKSVADQVATGVTNARLYARVQRQATTDGLTGLYNHRTGQEKLAEQLRLAERYQRNLAVVMLDVDHFKSINDNYGHPAGDTVLKAVAKLVKSDCRDVDLPVRYGGEEFLLVLPEVNQEGAAVVAERIRKSLSQEVIHHEDIQISVTASFGIAAFPEDAHNQQSLLDLADKALYLSKRLGRNQVHTAGDLMFEEISPTKLPEAARAEAHHADDLEEELEEDEERILSHPQQAPEPIAQLITLPSNTYADFVPTAVSAAAEQKEELVPEVVEMVKALATALYSKSDYNKQHHLETARLSELLAKVMGLSQQQVEQIRVAGLLHDVGTLSIPSDLLNKPGRYSADEREIINQHAVLGAQLLRPIRALKDICEILENHHERWDGTGYPRGLKGEEIPLPARIVAIVDSYHAMISDRPYRDAMTREQAIQTLKGGAGIQWDPFLVDIFVAVLASLNDPRSAPLAAPALVAEPPKLPGSHVQAVPNRISAQPAMQAQPAAAVEEQSAVPVAPRVVEAPPIAQDMVPSTSTTSSSSDSQVLPTPEPTPEPAAAPPVLNARQRLLMHSQAHQAMHNQNQNQNEPAQVPVPPEVVPTQVAVPHQPLALPGDLDDQDDFEEFDEIDDDFDNAEAAREGRQSAQQHISQPLPQQPAPQQVSQQLSPQLAPQQASQQQFPQLAPQHISQQLPQQPAPQQVSQQLAQQPAPQHISQQLPQQPAPQQASQQQSPQLAPSHISQPLPQQPAPQQASQQPSQQPAPQHISQQLPQQPAPQQVAQQPPQQPVPQYVPRQFSQHPAVQEASQHLFQQEAQQPLPQQLAPQQNPPEHQQPQQAQAPQQPQQVSQQLPQQPAPHQNQQQPPQPQPQHNFPQQQTPQPQAQPAAPQPQFAQPQPHTQPGSQPSPQQQQYAPLPQYQPAPKPMVPTNPLVAPNAHQATPQQTPGYAVPDRPAQPAQPPATPPEHEQPRPANSDQFFEEP